LGLLLASTTASLAADWTIVDLGSLPGATLTSPAAINASGDAVGSSGSPSVTRPVLFANGAVLDLGTFGGNGGSLAYDINEHGTIVGGAAGPGGLNRAFVYNNGVMTDLGTLNGDRSVALAINNTGQIVGQTSNASGETEAFVHENGVMSPITSGTALDINSHGLVVGISGNVPDASFTYINGNLQYLTGGFAWAVNDNGTIVGQRYAGSVIEAAYFSNGEWSGIGTLGGGEAYAIGLNNREQIVGGSRIDAGSQERAFLYSNGVLHRLDDLLVSESGWDYLATAYDINDRGQIVGSGRKDGEWRAFLMTPTIDTFDLEVTYSNPLVSVGDGELPAAEVTARFVLEGIGGMPGTFRLEDVVSAYVEFADGVWTELDLASFQMTLGPGGVDDILTLSYNFDPLVTPSGAELSLRNNSFQLYIDGVLPDSGETFSYFYPDSEQSLSVVPEPSSLALAAIAGVGLLFAQRRRQRN